MRNIWKFPLVLTDRQLVDLPEGARPLCVQVQHGEACMWALCNPVAPKVLRNVSIYGTGHPVPDDPGDYVGTIQLNGGVLVLHVFIEPVPRRTDMPDDGA